MPTLHICYIHGWRGDHTSFQSFPTDLHSHLEPQLPGWTLNTHIYPTYKAERPIQEAVLKLLKWLDTLPEGYVILSGHSLGGFLAADAALMNTKMNDARHRVIGVLSYDVPFLGIHPHVVISGIASLFQSNKDAESEETINDPNKVNVVKPQESTDSLISPLPSPSLAPPSPSRFKRAFNFISKHLDEPIVASSKKWLTEQFEFGSAVIDHNGLSERYTALENWKYDWVQLFTVTVPKNEDANNSGYLTPQPVGDAPATVGDHAVETNPYDGQASPVPSPHPAAFFNRPPSMSQRLSSEFDDLVGKNKPKKVKHVKTSKQEESVPVESPSTPALPREESPLPPDTPTQLKEDTSKKRSFTPRHFIVLPFAMGYRWQSVPIAGSDDEVDAHCGIFFRNKNLEYDQFIGHVAGLVVTWASKYKNQDLSVA